MKTLTKKLRTLKKKNQSAFNFGQNQHTFKKNFKVRYEYASTFFSVKTLNAL